MDRRSLIKVGAAAGAAAWVVPQVVSMSSAAAASPPSPNCYTFEDQTLEGWTPTPGGGVLANQLGRNCLQPAIGTGGVIFGPAVPTPGITSLATSLLYSSPGGGVGFVGVQLYSDAAGTISIGEIWIYGQSVGPWGQLVSMSAGAAWTQYSVNVPLPAGTASVRFKAENFAVETNGDPVYFDDICYSG